MRSSHESHKKGIKFSQLQLVEKEVSARLSAFRDNGQMQSTEQWAQYKPKNNSV